MKGHEDMREDKEETAGGQGTQRDRRTQGHRRHKQTQGDAEK